MHSKIFSIAALVSAAYGQGTGLAAALTGNNQTSQLAGLLGTIPGITEQLSSLTNITLLAPSNSALAALLNSSAAAGLTSNPGLLQAVLTYHVLNGTYVASAIPTTPAFVPSALVDPTYANVTGGQRVEAIRAGDKVTFFSGLLQNTSVTQANINFTGGIIHVIDHVLTLPQNVSSTLVNADLSSLYGALNATGLLSTVNGLRDVTIFAPANSAFQAIGSALETASTADLQSILTYHVVNGTAPLYSTDLTSNASYKTVQGSSINIHAGANGTLFVNGAKVITPNVLIAGGVVHVIDNVLNPNSTSSASPSASAGSPAFSGASSVSNVPFTSGVATPTSTVGGAATSAASSRSSSAGGMPMMTGAVGMGAIFGAGAVLANM